MHVEFREGSRSDSAADELKLGGEHDKVNECHFASYIQPKRVGSVYV